MCIMLQKHFANHLIILLNHLHNDLEWSADLRAYYLHHVRVEINRSIASCEPQVAVCIHSGSGYQTTARGIVFFMQALLHQTRNQKFSQFSKEYI